MKQILLFSFSSINNFWEAYKVKEKSTVNNSSSIWSDLINLFNDMYWTLSAKGCSRHWE